MKFIYFLLFLLCVSQPIAVASPASTKIASTLSHYEPRGIGGGGAMASYSISPYSKLRLVGTDMGTLFRSLDGGKSWTPISHKQVQVGSDLNLASEIGFSADAKTLFFAESGHEPKRSLDAGETWAKINLPLKDQERIRYFLGDPKNPRTILCGTSEGLFISLNLGDQWTRVSGISGSSTGSLFLSHKGKTSIFHASEKEIWISLDQGKNFHKWFGLASTHIRAFSGGEDDAGTTLAFIDTDGENACAWAKGARDATSEQKENTYKDCGYVWIQKFKDEKDPGTFIRQKKEGGRFIRMASNDSNTLYLTGGDWVRQYGSKIWISRNSGEQWNLALQVFDWDQHPYQPWSKNHLEYSAIGLDVGWHDNAPTSFAVNLLNASEAGTTGFYFLHSTKDFGEHWQAPFTQFADSGERLPHKKWKSTGLEVTSIMRLKFHPKVPKLAYASVSDLGGLVTEDGGKTFRISKAKYNTNYDYAFDPKLPDFAFSASGSHHDFPLNINTPLHEEGGIFATKDRGKTWNRLTPSDQNFNRQFLSVAFDPLHQIIYGGTEGAGIVRSKDNGKHWEWINLGFPKCEQVIPQIEIDPRDGTAYALLTGIAPDFLNAEETGIYKLSKSGSWKLLRKTVLRPKEIIDPKIPLWQFPSAFAIDFTNPIPNTFWLTDIENKGAWLASGVWRSTNGGDTWERKTQFTHPTQITLAPNQNNEIANKIVIVSGLDDVSGKWGLGGALISKDGGTHFIKNDKIPLLSNLFGVTLDPLHSENAFFLFFGGGMLYGPIIGLQ